MKIIKRIYSGFQSRLKWLIYDLSFFLFSFSNNHKNHNYQADYSIGITTFLDRFHSDFKPLLNKLEVLFPDKEILIAVNGHYKEKEQSAYLSEMKNFVSGFPNVKLITHLKPQGLSRLWNQIISTAENSRILILNDDLKIAYSLRSDLENSEIFNSGVSVINHTWGHFVISKNIVGKIGGFDENLIEIGGEDDDYAARLAIAGIDINNCTIKSIANFSKKLKVNSYGKDMTGEHRYSALNTDYLLNKKWIISNEPFEGSVYVPDRAYRYWKLRNN
jgi:hypothetical protein